MSRLPKRDFTVSKKRPTWSHLDTSAISPSTSPPVVCFNSEEALSTDSRVLPQIATAAPNLKRFRNGAADSTRAARHHSMFSSKKRCHETILRRTNEATNYEQLMIDSK